MVRVFVTVAALMINMPLIVQAGLPKMTNQSALEFMRRLQDTQQKGVFSEACVAACPAISGVIAGDSSYKTHTEDLQAKYASMGQTEMMKHIGEMMSDMMMLAFDEVCTNKDTFKCAADNAAACEDPSGQDQSGFADTIKHMDCLCDTCSSLQQGYADYSGMMMGVLMQAFAAMGGEPAPNPEETEAKVMKTTCSLATGLECAKANEQTCSGLFEHDDSGSSGGDGGMTISMSSTMNTDMLEGLEQLKQNCTAQGYALSTSAGDTATPKVSSARIATQSVLSVCTAIAIHFIV